MILTMEKKLAQIRQQKDSEVSPGAKYKRWGYSIPELAMYAIGVLFLMAAAYLSWPSIRDFLRSTSQSMELRNMQTAATTYTSLRLDGNPPTSAKDLIDGLDAKDSVDGIAHDAFMTAKSGRWKDGNYTDAWGEDFTFGKELDGQNYITSNGPDKQYGTDDDITVYY